MLHFQIWKFYFYLFIGICEYENLVLVYNLFTLVSLNFSKYMFHNIVCIVQKILFKKV